LQVSWDLLLKAYHFPAQFRDPKYHDALKNILDEMRWGHTEFVDPKATDRGHYEKRLEERFAPKQDMPKGFENNTPEELALAMAELTLRNHPELSDALSMGENPNEYPSMIMEALHTDEPQEYKDDSGQTRTAHTYTPVLVRDETGKIGVKSVVGGMDSTTGKGQGTRPTIKVMPQNSLKPQALENRGIHHELPGLFDMGNQFAAEEATDIPDISTRAYRDQIIDEADIATITPDTMASLGIKVPKKNWPQRGMPRYEQLARKLLESLGSFSTVETSPERKLRLEQEAKDAEERQRLQQEEEERQRSLMAAQVSPEVQAQIDQLAALGIIGAPKQQTTQPTQTMCMGCGSAVDTNLSTCPSCGYQMKSEPMDLAWGLLKEKKPDPRLKAAGVSGYNKPKRTPNHPKKSHVVVARSGGKVKTIRFGEQGADTVTEDNPKGKRAKKRASFKARHQKNIKRGPMSAAYWADKVKW